MENLVSENLVPKKKSRLRFRRIWFQKIWSRKKSLGFGFGKFGLGKKVSVLVSEKFGLGKKSRFRKIWYRKKSLGISFGQNFGIVIQCWKAVCSMEDSSIYRCVIILLKGTFNFWIFSAKVSLSLINCCLACSASLVPQLRPQLSPSRRLNLPLL